MGLKMIAADAQSAVDVVGKAQTLVERGPLAFVAALGFVVAVFSIYLLLRSKDKHLLDKERMQAAFDRTLSEVNKTHSSKLDELREAQAERSIKLEIMLHSFLELSEDFRFIAFEARKRAERRERPKSGEHKLPGGQNEPPR